jgi:hypothetical protein
MKRLSIIVIALCFAACGNSHQQASTADSAKKTDVPIDSQKAIGAGVNGQTSNDLSTLDTTKAGHTVANPKTDTPAKKKH